MERTETIVIVDDDREIRTVMELALAAPGRRIVLFSDGAAVISYLRSGARVDLVVSDVAMEGFDGHQLLRHLRANPHAAPAPVIFVSAGDPGDDRTPSLDGGAVRHLKKPFEIGHLRDCVSAALRKPASDDAKRDPLTGLHTRAQFDRALASAIGSAVANRPLAVVIGDLDEFDAVKLRFEGAEMDGVLRRVAEIIAMHLRATDVAARIDDHRFASLHPACDAAAAAAIADRIRAAVSTDDRCIGVELSFGIAVTAAQDVADAADMLKRADEELRASKHQP